MHVQILWSTGVEGSGSGFAYNQWCLLTPCNSDPPYVFPEGWEAIFLNMTSSWVHVLCLWTHILGVSNLVKSYNVGMYSLPFLLKPSWCCSRLDVYSAWRHLLYSCRDLEPPNNWFWWIKEVWMVAANLICWHSSHFAPVSNLVDDAHIMVQWNKLITYWYVVSVPCGVCV